MKDYDVFVSYKSDDVMSVRPVVDGLIAAGARVWFAEYEVLLAGRERFQERIDDGIRHSAHGLAFTNDTYVESEYCRREMVQLLEHCGPERIIEVRLPPGPATHRAYPDLRGADAVETTSVDEIVDRAGRRLGFRRLPRPTPHRRPYRDAAGRHAGTRRSPPAYEGELAGRPYRVRLDGWTLEAAAGPLPQFKYAVSNPVLYANVAAGLDVSPEAQRLAEVQDERAVYNYLLTYAPRHLGAVGTTPVGVHLILRDGVSQMGLTYFVENPGGPGIWTRKVSIIVSNRDLGRTGEFVFTFGLLGGDAQWRDYCLMAPLMDDLATSVTW